MSNRQVGTRTSSGRVPQLARAMTERMAKHCGESSWIRNQIVMRSIRDSWLSNGTDLFCNPGGRTLKKAIFRDAVMRT